LFDLTGIRDRSEQIVNKNIMKHSLRYPGAMLHLRALSAIILLFLTLFLAPAGGQSTHKADASASGVSVKVEQELISTEMGFFEAWKAKDQAYFRAHMLENGVFWGESGTVAREQQLQLQQIADKTCNVEGYGLTDFGVLPIATGAYLLTYKVDQYATCNGEKLPVHMNGSSIYVLKAGQWQAIYRAEVPLVNQQ
jgi:hypothetical protein